MLDGVMYLLTLDYYSKWLSIAPLHDTQSIDVIRELKRIFADFGSHEILVAVHNLEATHFDVSRVTRWCSIPCRVLPIQCRTVKRNEWFKRGRTCCENVRRTTPIINKDTLKLWERVVESRLRKMVNISERQYGFQPGKSTIQPLFCLRMLQEKHREFGKELHAVFVDLEKAYDRVPRELIWYSLRRKGVPEAYINIIRDMYAGCKTSVMTSAGKTKGIEIEVGLHQGSALSPLLFVIIIDVITEEIEEGTPWAMLFADDLVLCDPDRQMMELRLERWRECMEKNGLKVSRAKTEHLQTIGDTDPVRMKRYMETEMVNLPTVQSFKYLGSTIDRRGGASKDVDNRVAKAWSKWRELSGVICDKKIPTKLKLLIYQTVIRPTLLYGCETWPMSVKDEKRMSTTEMRMVRWAMGVSLLEHRRNEEILEEAKVEAIATVMRRRRLEWFGHVKRRGETENIRAVAEMKMEGKRPRGRPKLRWNDTIRRDLKAWKIKEEWATDREKWKGLCKTRYPEQGDGGER